MNTIKHIPDPTSLTHSGAENKNPPVTLSAPPAHLEFELDLIGVRRDSRFIDGEW